MTGQSEKNQCLGWQKQMHVPVSIFSKSRLDFYLLQAERGKSVSALIMW